MTESQGTQSVIQWTPRRNKDHRQATGYSVQADKRRMEIVREVSARDLRDTHKAEHSPLRLIPVQKETITTSFMFCFGGIGYCRSTRLPSGPPPA